MKPQIASSLVLGGLLFTLSGCNTGQPLSAPPSATKKEVKGAASRVAPFLTRIISKIEAGWPF